MLISVRWQLLPASGFVPPSEDLWLNIKTMIMPAFVLGTGLAASLMRHTRSAMLGVLRSDYIRTARAKGLVSRVVILKHALRNALIPIVTLSTLLFGELLAGAVLTEQIFTIPGFGKLVVDAVFNRDYAVVQGVVLCTAVGFIFMNLLGRRPLCSRQSAPEACTMTIAITEDVVLPKKRNRDPLQVPAQPKRSSRRRGSSLFFVILAIVAPLLAPYDPIKPSFTTIRKAPSAMFWFGTDELGRDIFSRMFCGARASLMAGVVSVAIAVAARRTVRPDLRLFRRLDRRDDLALDRCHAGDPVPDLRHRARGVPRSESHQRDDRHRFLGHADLRPAHARSGAHDQGRGLCRRRARDRAAEFLDHRALHFPQRAAADPGPGDADGRNRDHRGGEPVVSRARPATAEPVLGIDAQHGQELHGHRRPGCRFFRARRSS